jgi:hypothetical protein
MISRGRKKGEIVHFTSETCFGGFEEVDSVVSGEFKCIGDAVESLNGEFAGLVETICDSDGMNASID